VNDSAIRVENLSKRYEIGKEKDGSLRGTLSSLTKGRKGNVEEFWALRDINLEIERGDVVGIIGKNGAGKSTLLKILSQITRPTTGRIEINGRVASLLEVGTGFHPELTGRENIYLNGTILGMTRKEVKAKFEEIVDFSGVGKFIDTPVKHYSSGMYVRLAFSVAAHLEPEILIIDEVLAVGDADFQKKCLGKMQDVAEHGRTVLFVSHNLGSISLLCQKGLLLSQGKLVHQGEIGEVIKQYQSISSSLSNIYHLESSEKPIFLKKARIISSTNDFYHDEKISFSFEIGHNINVLTNKYILIRFLDNLEQTIFSTEIELDFNFRNYILEVPPFTFTKGYFPVNAILYHPAVAQYDNVHSCCQFNILDNAPVFAHLEGFDIGKIYVNLVWNKI
jgi:lipopolysaccharide transport system ATP-binding protein